MDLSEKCPSVMCHFDDFFETMSIGVFSLIFLEKTHNDIAVFYEKSKVRVVEEIGGWGYGLASE